MSLEIPFECNKTVNDFELSDKGFFCGDCNHHIVDLRNPGQPLPVSGSCVIIHENSVEQSIARKITYRFALTMFLVMGSSIIVNNNLQAHELVNHFDNLREKFVNEDSTSFYLHGTVSDPSGKPITPVKVTIELSDGEKMEVNAYGRRYHESMFNFIVPKTEINKKVKITYEYFGELKTLDLVIGEDGVEVPNQTFKRDKKDRYSKKRYPKKMVVGKFKF